MDVVVARRRLVYIHSWIRLRCANSGWDERGILVTVTLHDTEVIL